MGNPAEPTLPREIPGQNPTFLLPRGYRCQREKPWEVTSLNIPLTTMKTEQLSERAPVGREGQETARLQHSGTHTGGSVPMGAGCKARRPTGRMGLLFFS